jgi:hypothetical protein
MDPDIALLEAWSLDEEADPLTAEIVERERQLLPLLVRAGYAEVQPGEDDFSVWSFTPQAKTRVRQLQQQRVHSALKRIQELEQQQRPPDAAPLAEAYLSYARGLNDLGRFEEELRVYDHVTASFASSRLPAVRKQVALAQSSKAKTLEFLRQAQVELDDWTRRRRE